MMPLEKRPSDVIEREVEEAVGDEAELGGYNKMVWRYISLIRST
jgi:hypothetical protein